MRVADGFNADSSLKTGYFSCLRVCVCVCGANVLLMNLKFGIRLFTTKPLPKLILANLVVHKSQPNESETKKNRATHMKGFYHCDIRESISVLYIQFTSPYFSYARILFA